MNPKTNNNYLNLKFDGLIDNCKNHLYGKISDSCGYQSEILLDCLMQRVVEVALPAYAFAVDKECKSTTGIFPSYGTQINCGLVNIEGETGRVSITIKQYAQNLVEFIKHWIYCLIAIIAFRAKSTGNIPAVLIFGVGEESLFNNGTDKRFVEYCRTCPIEPLSRGQRFLVQTLKKFNSLSDTRFSYQRDPVMGLLCESRIGIIGRARLLIHHLALLPRYLYAVARIPLLSLLGRDMAYSQIVFELDRRGLIEAVVFTTSNFMRQPLWSRGMSRASIHMVWYAQNFKPIIYRSDALESDLPNVRWIRAGTHWVWTHAYGEYLESLGLQATMKTVGPILWYPTERMSPDKNSIKIVIFDVSPFNDDVALQYGDISNYNHPDNLFRFIHDVVAIKTDLEKRFGVPVALSLKTKRGYNVAYDKPYFDHLEALAAQGILTLEDPATNMYSLISESHLVVLYPFSSPAYIADYLRVPSIYYDPTGAILSHDFGDESSLIEFSGSPSSLLDVATSKIRKVIGSDALSLC